MEWMLQSLTRLVDLGFFKSITSQSKRLARLALLPSKPDVPDLLSYCIFRAELIYVILTVPTISAQLNCVPGVGTRSSG